MTQKATVLRVLEERGEQGVHSFELYDMRIPRNAAVVHQLKKDGHPIVAERETFKGQAEGVRYFLRGTELVARASSRPQKTGGGGSSPYDVFGDWS